MKNILIASTLTMIILHNGYAQNSALVLSSKQFNEKQQIQLAELESWVFKEGNNPDWADPNFDDTSWKPFKPTELSTKLADEAGRVEGWFRVKLRLDSSFKEIPLGVNRMLWAATDVYIDGKLFHSFGNTGNPYQAYNPILKYPLPLDLSFGNEHFLAIHFVDYETTFTQRELRLKSDYLKELINITGPGYKDFVRNDIKQTHIYGTLCIGVSFLLSFLFTLLVFLNAGQQIFRIIALLTLLVFLASVGSYLQTFFEISYPMEKLRYVITMLILPIMGALTLFIIEKILKGKTSWITIGILILLPIASLAGHLFNISPPFGIVMTCLIGYFIYLIVHSWKFISKAQWAVIIGMFVTIVSATIQVSLHKLLPQYSYQFEKLTLSFSLLGSPLFLLVFVSIRFKEILNDVSIEANKVLNVTEEKKEILANQNRILEKQVEERTSELKQSLDNLKSTQRQLIQSEKMASLGELTAGIAHEIQNPLNFVNNFSEVSNELLQELKAEKLKVNRDEKLEEEILNDISTNLEKITHHGKRAGSIVSGMLQHSRTSTGKIESTNINNLADEYLRLAFHGLRAKDKSFNADFKTDFDETIGNLNIVPQDMGRVILNLITNAFYAVTNKNPLIPEGGIKYQPMVIVSSRKVGSKILLSVKDNGNGIPQKIIDKIFQPFFTTKPTGQGTGLGLSLAYDIVKAHGGELKVETKEGEGSEFIVELPLSGV